MTGPFERAQTSAAVRLHLDGKQRFSLKNRLFRLALAEEVALPDAETTPMAVAGDRVPEEPSHMHRKAC